MLEGMLEREGVVKALESKIVPFEVVYWIVDVFTDTMPAHSLWFLDFGWKAENLHSVVVEWIWFHQINHIEFDFNAFRRISHSKEVPLGVTVCVYVIL